MSTQKQVSILGIVALLILALTGCSKTREQSSAETQSPVTQSEQAKVAQAQETPQIVAGELTKVDATSKTLSVKSSEGLEMEFRYKDQTQISGVEGRLEGLATKSGTPVSVHYDTASKMATQIEVRPRQQ